MTEIDQKKNLTNQIATGLAIVTVETRFHKNMTPNTARHSGQAALAISGAQMDNRIIGPVLVNSGQSTGEIIGVTEQVVPVNSNWENSLQEFPDGTFVHISEEVHRPDPLNQASKPAVVKPDSNTLTRRENMRRLIMHVFCTSGDPANYGIKDWFTKKSEAQQNDSDTLLKFPERKELQLAG